MKPRSSLPPLTSMTFLSVAHAGSELPGCVYQKPGVRVTQSLLQLVSGSPQPHTPGAVLFGLLGPPQMQWGRPSPSRSVSGTPQPQTPGAILFGSFGQPSGQSGVPSPSASGSATPQPHSPGAVLFG